MSTILDSLAITQRVGTGFLASLTLFTPLCVAQCCSSAIKPNGTTVSKGLVGGTPWELAIETSALPSSASPKFYPQCTASKLACSITSHLSLRFGSKEVFVPKSAYADLGDITSTSFAAGKERSTLTISGGDASESYRAVLIFRQHTLVARRVYSGEDLSHPLEVSRFYVVTTKN